VRRSIGFHERRFDLNDDDGEKPFTLFAHPNSSHKLQNTSKVTMFAARSTLTSSIRRAASRPAEFRRFVHIEKRLEELGIELPTAPVPKANYNIICRASGNMMYISGHLPITADGKLLTGRIGPGTGGETVEHGYTAARHCALNIVSTLKSQLGDLE
jgi:hypothetical protein